ncbi:MAG: cobalamin-binding protein [Rhodocyclaceae bacterium]|nr:cobalamin-binding protein [Rhodocyclaceae bacterium]
MARFLLLPLLFLCSPTWADIAVTDDVGQTVRLAAPARRIISLAPHLTENLYAAGAGGRLVGVVDYSDWPEAAKKLPRVGSSDRADLEAILAQKPDLVLAWESGNARAHLAKLRALGIPVYVSQPKHLDDVAGEIERLGRLTGTEAVAKAAARDFRARQAGLKARYGGRPPVRTFYQVWNQPLLTVNGEHIIADVIKLCGGENVFGSLAQLAPAVAEEAVVVANPEVIVASGMAEARPDWLDAWKRWKQLTATSRDNLFFIPPDFLHRATIRILDGAERLCTQLETARGRRP